MAGCVLPVAFLIRGKVERQDQQEQANRQQQKHRMAVNHHRISSLELFRPSSWCRPRSLAPLNGLH